MPATSDKQRKLMAIAEHNPSKLYKKNKGVLKMSDKQLHEFASTKGLKKTPLKRDTERQSNARKNRTLLKR